MEELQSGKLTVLEIASKLKEITEQFGEESEGGKNLDLCETVFLFPTIFFDTCMLAVERVRTFGSYVFLTDKDYSFIVGISEDEENPGEPLLIYENLLLRGPGCSEVGKCEGIDSYDMEFILEIVMETIKPVSQL